MRNYWIGKLYILQLKIENIFKGEYIVYYKNHLQTKK